MEYIGKISIKIYHVITEDIISDEVILSDSQKRHIQSRHPEVYEKYRIYLSSIISEPDYLIKANKPNTALILKEIKTIDSIFKLVLRIQTSTDPSAYKNSIITFMKINDKEWNRLLRNKKILYKRDDPL